MNTQFRAITVCVDYSDLLRITLPYNLHHFSELWVVTSNMDEATQNFLAMYPSVKVFVTDSFYDDGASFNKWKALEEGLDEMGRHGWLWIWDADMLFPKEIPDFNYKKNYLYTPLRRIAVNPTQVDLTDERRWSQYPYASNQKEWAGYSQMFHSTDVHLPGNTPWHEINWMHAGGADSFFQQRWPVTDKHRPPFESLHLGRVSENWCGRVTPLTDGSIPEMAKERSERLAFFFKTRRGPQYRGDQFEAEKIQKK